MNTQKQIFTIHLEADMEEVKREYVKLVIQRHNGCRYKAADQLGIARSTLIRWLRSWGLGKFELNSRTDVGKVFQIDSFRKHRSAHGHR